MKPKVLLLILVVAALGVLAYLLVRGAGKPHEVATGSGSVSEPDRPSSSGGGGSSGAPVRPPLVGSSPGTGSVAAAAPDVRPRLTEAGVNPAEPGIAPLQAKAAKAALLRQRDLYRVELRAIQERIVNVKKRLQDLEKSGAATPIQLQQIQTQLQQMVDAEPRMKLRVQELEGQLKKQKLEEELRDREKSEKKP